MELEEESGPRQEGAREESRERAQNKVRKICPNEDYKRTEEGGKKGHHPCSLLPPFGI